MAKHKGTERGRLLTELRQSNAAGFHDSRPARSEAERAALEEELTAEYEPVLGWSHCEAVSPGEWRERYYDYLEAAGETGP